MIVIVFSSLGSYLRIYCDQCETKLPNSELSFSRSLVEFLESSYVDLRARTGRSP